MADKKVSAGVGVMIEKDGKVLLGLRTSDESKGTSDLKGEGTWTFPGGKIDFGDSLFDSVQREVKEETDLDVEEIELMSINNFIVDPNQYFTFGFRVKKFSGEVKTMEPDEITEWKWFDMDDLPENLYVATKAMIKMVRSGELVDLNEK